MRRSGTALLALAIFVAAAASARVSAQPGQSASPTPAEQAKPIEAGEAAGEDATAIAKKLQNPIADLISVPFQNNANFGSGPLKGTQDILNIQPVVPFHLNQDWTLITRTILPLTWQPRLGPGAGAAFGLGDVTESLFLSPKTPIGGVILGFGPAFVLPSATTGKVGSNIWGGGPTAVALRMDGPWVYGALTNNLFSFGGHSGPGGNSYNSFLLQPFVNYNFSGGWYVSSSPIITANWQAKSGQQWLVPVGGGAGRVVRLGTLPVNLSLAAYYNALRPSGIGPEWVLRAQVTFLLPSF